MTTLTHFGIRQSPVFVGETVRDQEVVHYVAPLVQALREQMAFEAEPTGYPDGVVSNFSFSGDAEAAPVWRYPGLGLHVVYLSGIIRRTITEQMHEEWRYLRSHARARAALKEVMEMPDHQADRVLRTIEHNRGKLSNAVSCRFRPIGAPGCVSIYYPPL